jgi:hypothetical protein
MYGVRGEVLGVGERQKEMVSERGRGRKRAHSAPFPFPFGGTKMTTTGYTWFGYLGRGPTVMAIAEARMYGEG